MSTWLSRERIEWAVRIYKDIRGRPLTRWGGYLLLGALAIWSNVLQLFLAGIFLMFGHKLEVPEAPLIVFYVLVGTGCLLLILDRCLPDRVNFLPVAYPHDEKLLAKIRQTFTSETDYFLREHDFGSGSFKHSILDPIFTVGSWKGNQFEFIDQSVNALWAKVKRAAKTLSLEVAAKTVPAMHESRVTTVFDGEDPDWHTQAMAERFKILNDAANDLIAVWDEFDGLARRNIPKVD